jgi:phosphoglycerate kinase
MLYLKDLELKNRTVFLRVDFNVPLDKETGQIRDDTRIQAALPTLKYLIEHQAKIVAASHLGRPKGKYNPQLSLKPVAQRLQEILPTRVTLAPDVIGEKVEKLKQTLQPGEVLLLENIRFYPGEKENDTSFAQALASGIEVYVNDAFGACHRAHASIVALPRLVPLAGVGFLLEKEIKNLEKIIHQPARPFIAILGGAKVADKIPVIKNLLTKASEMLIGGAMAYTFLLALSQEVGRSLVDENNVSTCRELLELAKKNNVALHLPSDHVAAPSPEEPVNQHLISDSPFPANLMGLDIGPKTREFYAERIKQAKTIFWNGPMGVFEIPAFAQGTLAVAQAVANSRAFSVIGGGDSVAAVTQAGVASKISHISTGGGASLEYIANETLPGIEALKEKNK